MTRFGNALTEYSPQMEAFEYAGEQESGPVFNEQQEMELAAEFLEISSEQELENFLGAHCTGIESVFALRQRLDLSRAACAVGAVGARFSLKSKLEPGAIAR